MMKRFFQRYRSTAVKVYFLGLCLALTAFTLPVEPSGQISVSKSPSGDVVQLSQLLVGEQGERIREISTGTVSINPPNIATVTRGAATFTLSGAAVGDLVVLLPPAALNDDLLFVGANVTGANTVTVYLYNPTAGAIDDGAQTWRWLWLDTT